jgi:hypothetical protein
VKNYDTVAEEIRSGNIDPGSWARAMSEAEGDKRKAEAAYIRIRAARVARTRFTKIVAFALTSLVILSAVAGGIVLARDWLEARRLQSFESHLRSVPLTPPTLIKGNVVPVLDGIEPWQLEWRHDGKTPLPSYWSQIDSALAGQIILVRYSTWPSGTPEVMESRSTLARHWSIAGGQPLSITSQPREH